LSLKFNALSGTVPSELSALSSLEELWLHSNQLTGTLPPQLSALSSSMRQMWFCDNQLTGEIPAQLSALSRLENLCPQELSGARQLGSEASGRPHRPTKGCCWNQWTGHRQHPHKFRVCGLLQSQLKSSSLWTSFVWDGLPHMSQHSLSHWRDPLWRAVSSGILWR